MEPETKEIFQGCAGVDTTGQKVQFKKERVKWLERLAQDFAITLVPLWREGMPMKGLWNQPVWSVSHAPYHSKTWASRLPTQRLSFSKCYNGVCHSKFIKLFLD